ncbi:acyl carrier protein [Sphingomonas sp.]|uniref:acyl carrier protein n=1 Tax=Sphingomonas sp. TaxID=28214 RepID=UPI0035A99FB0
MDARKSGLPSTDTRTRYHRVIREHLGVAPEQITDEAEFADDLGADSLDMIELVAAFDDEFHLTISDDDAETVVTVKDGLDLVERLLGGEVARG